MDDSELTITYDDPVRDNEPWAGCPEPAGDPAPAQTPAMATTSVWSATGTATMVTVTKTPATTTSAVSTNSINFDNSAVYDATVDTDKTTAANYEGTTTSHEGTVEPVTDSSTTDRFVQDVEWTTKSADPGELDGVSSTTFALTGETSGNAVTVHTVSVTARMNQESTVSDTTPPINIRINNFL